LHDRDFYKDSLFGVAIGDAVGVPYEFRSREAIARNPAKDMVGYGTYDLPPGTWSDDASLTFCLADALCTDFDLQKIANNFLAWRYDNFWTARGEVFDVGMTTQRAIERLAKKVRPDLAGDFDASSNGNGSLMRILPLLFHIKNMPITERYDIVRKVSSITHGHIRSAIACFYYLEFGRQLLSNDDLTEAYHETNAHVKAFFNKTTIVKEEIAIFDRLFNGDIPNLEMNDINSSGYVVHTLEASIWCLMKTGCYRDAILLAVNLGSDTDTTAAVTGGLAGLLYSYDNIPEDWRLKLARKKDIEDLAERLRQKFTK